jgi:hypothetical protein
MKIQETRLILAMLEKEARLQKRWRVTYMTKIGKRKIREQWIQNKVVYAYTKDEAQLKADIWSPLIIKIERI